MIRQSFPAKLAGETLTLTFEFASALATGESISSGTVTCSVFSGTDSNPSAVISGTATASGTQILQKVTGGLQGVVYSLIATGTTSAGQTVQCSAFLSVSQSAV